MSEQTITYACMYGNMHFLEASVGLRHVMYVLNTVCVLHTMHLYACMKIHTYTDRFSCFFFSFLLTTASRGRSIIFVICVSNKNFSTARCVSHTLRA